MLKQILFISCIVFTAVLLLIYIFQRHLIYFPDRHTPNLQKYHATDMTVITLETADNQSLKSWYKAAMNQQATIIYLHGNAGNVGYRIPYIRHFLDAGLGVLLLEYRGYGGNKGSPTEQGFYADGKAALNFLIQKGIKPDKIAIYGESLGTGVATKIASENPVCAVVLQSPFTSLASIAQHHYPWMFLKPWDKFNSLKRIKNINAPLLILHGKKDPVVPYQEGLILFAAANEPKKMLSFGEKGHNNLWEDNTASTAAIHFIQSNCP